MRQATYGLENKIGDEYATDEFVMMFHMCSLQEDAIAISLMQPDIMRFEIYMAVRNNNFRYLNPKLFMPALDFLL